MHCLLCHEKIPRLRVWRTKSEFCCEEHAALYKKQTLERLLVDPNSAQSSVQATLPEPPEPQEFEVEEPAPAAKAKAPVEGDEFEFWERFDRTDEAREESVELPPPADEDAGEGIDELWKLQDNANARASGETTDPQRQSAEDALAALRDLANRAAGETEQPTVEDRSTVFEMPAPSEPADEVSRDVYPHERAFGFDEAQPATDEPEPAAEQSATEQSLFQAEPETAPAEQEAEPVAEERPYTPQGRRYGEEPEDDSILDQLMADPLESWKQERAGVDAAQPGETAGDEAHSEESALEEAEAAADLAPAIERLAEGLGVDLDAPEPDWEFADASSELSALKESLASSGSPPVAFEESSAVGDVDTSPVEPDWEELEEIEALDLSDADIDPPEPDLALEDEEPSKVVPFPGSAAEEVESAAASEQAEPAASDTETHRSPGTRFRPVLAMVELEPDMADWESSDAAQQVESEAVLATGGVESEQYQLPGAPEALRPGNAGIQGLDTVLRADVAAAPGENGEHQPAEAPSEIAAPPGTLFLPTATGSTWTQTSELNMHQGSVEIEPAAALADPSADGSTAALAAEIDGPFEPAGLFFDINGAGGFGEAAPDAEDEADAAGAAAGPARETPQGAV